MTDCHRLGKLFGGCKFRARHDLGPADLSQFSSIKGLPPDGLEQFRPKTYIHDICETCGKTVKRG